MSCDTCSQMRMAYLEAMIALDVKRMAGLTVAAAKHMIGGEIEPEFQPARQPVDTSQRTPDADGIQAGGGVAGGRIEGSAMGDGQHG